MISNSLLEPPESLPLSARLTSAPTIYRCINIYLIDHPGSLEASKDTWGKGGGDIEHPLILKG